MNASAQQTTNQQHNIEQFLYAVAAACDRQDWDQYLSFFSEDSVFHIPTMGNRASAYYRS
jgi:3-phenylpropionate/cinnamic acid dioxygenase small subunit